MIITSIFVCQQFSSMFRQIQVVVIVFVYSEASLFSDYNNPPFVNYCMKQQQQKST